MVDAMSVKEEMQEIFACRICLATDTELYSIQEDKLSETFAALMGTEVWWCGLTRVCGACRAQLSRAAALRARCRRAGKLLAAALKQQHYITIDYIRTIDRMAEKLCLNLKTCHVYSSDSTQPEVKLEVVKDEADDFTENIFISEPIVDDHRYTDIVETQTTHIDNNGITSDTPKKEIRNNKRKLECSKQTKRKLPKTTKDKNKLPSVTKKLPASNKKQEKKRVIKRRVADNGFLPDFDFEEFENKYNVKIDILSREEQMREVAARRMAVGYTLATFGCEQCGKGFATQHAYDAHNMKHEPAAGAHACGVCGVRFRTRSRAHVHADAHRLRFTCGTCGFVTRTRFIAKNHYLSHAGATHRCPHCDAVFTKYTSYLTHVRRRHPAMNVACDECGETFVGHNGLRHHKTRVHRNRMRAMHACGACGARFASEAARAAHARAGAGACDARDDPCEQCGKSRRAGASSPCACAARQRLCRECDMTFVDAASFDTHYARVHLHVRAQEPPRARARPARALMCELCGAACSSVSSLAAHQRGHAGARAHACPAPGCALRFATTHNMRRHHRVVHLGQRPLVSCGVCGKQLAHAASLKLHVNTVHLKQPAPPRRRRDN